MNKKELFAVLVLIIIFAGGGYLYIQSKNKKESTTDISSVFKEPKIYLFEQNSKITQVNSDSIVVDAYIKLSITTDSKLVTHKTIEIQTLPTTKFTNLENTITLDQIKSGKQFSPKTQSLSGSISDFVVTPEKRVTLVNMVTTDDPISMDKISVSGIKYITYVLPQLPQ